MRFHRPRLTRRSFWALAAILTWLGLRAVYDDFLTADRETTVDALPEGEYLVQEVGNDFTLVVQRPDGAPTFPDPRNQARGGRVQARVKLLGVRPVSELGEPRRIEIAAQVHELMRSRLMGHVVRLRLDRRRWDENHIFLAYVYLEDQLFNAQLLRAGLARLDVQAADVGQIVRQLRQAEDEARGARVGCWR